MRARRSGARWPLVAMLVAIGSTLLLAGCVRPPTGPTTARPSSNWQLRSGDAALVTFDLDDISEREGDEAKGFDLGPIEVREQRTDEGIIQLVVLENPTETHGENYIRIALRRRGGLFASLLETGEGLEDFALKINDRTIVEILQREFPIGTARVSDTIRQNRFGTYSHARLEMPRQPLACLFAWQKIETQPFGAFPVPFEAEGNIVFRYCAETESVAPLLKAFDSLTLEMRRGWTAPTQSDTRSNALFDRSPLFQ